MSCIDTEAPAYAAMLERALDPKRSFFAMRSLPRLLLSRAILGAPDDLLESDPGPLDARVS